MLQQNSDAAFAMSANPCVMLAAGVCGTSTDRQQQLQALLAAYPSSMPAGEAATQQQQEANELLAPASFLAESPEQVLYRWVHATGLKSHCDEQEPPSHPNTHSL